jgi:hypothetical protein
MFEGFGETATAGIVNIVRVAVAFLGLIAIALAIAVSGLAMLREHGPEMPWTVWAAVGLFAAGIIMLTLSAFYKIMSNPFLIEFALEAAQKNKASTTDIEKLVKVLEAHAGIAGVFNRLEFTGASLGTVVAAILVLIIGLIAVHLGIIAEYATFADIAKLLFGAIIGSYAGRILTVGHQSQ